MGFAAAVAIVGLLLIASMPQTAVSETQLPPWDGNLSSQMGVTGCGGGNSWRLGWNLSQGFINLYSKSSESYSAGCSGSASRLTSEDLKDGFYAAPFRWNSPTGTYKFNVSWGIGFRVTANASSSSVSCDVNSYWFLRTIAALFNQNTGANVVSGNESYAISNGTLLDECGTYSLTAPWNSFDYNVPGGVRMTEGDWYQPSSQIWLQTTVNADQTDSSDVAIDVWSTMAQSNYGQFYSYGISTP